MADADPSRVRARSPVVGLVLFVFIAVAALAVAKWWPYGERTATLIGDRQWSGTSVLTSGEQGPSLRAGWDFLLAYSKSVWLALVAAVLIGAATEALVPGEWLRRVFGRRATLRATAFALPGMMCTCCTAPIVHSLRRSGIGTPAAVAYWLANPVLNPAVLVFLALVGPWEWPVTRLFVGLLLVFGVAMLVARMAPAASVPLDAAPIGPSTDRAGSPARRYLRAVGRFGLVLVPEYVLLVFAVGALRGWLFPLDAGFTGHAALAVTVAAVLGLLVVIPTGGEIPVLLALTAAGFPPAVIGVLLITLPALSLPSAVMVARALTWRAVVVAVAGVCVAGLLAGALLTMI